MDRPLAPTAIRRRRLLRLGGGVVLAGLVVAAIGALTVWIRPSVERDRIRTAVAEEGVVEATVTASGLVVPAFEQVVSSPLDARVVQIHGQPGAVLTKGDLLVELDVSASREALATLNDQLALKENQRAQVELEWEGQRIDLESRLAIKALDVQARMRELADQEKRYAENLIEQETLLQAREDVERARIEHRQLAATLDNTRRTYEAQLAGLDLEAGIRRRDREATRREMEQARARTDRDGVLTWITPEVGATVRQGDVLARVADLSAFRIEATVPDVHAARLAVGQPVQVRIDTVTLAGSVSRVRPTVENGALTVDVTLDDPSHERLRPNLRTDVEIVTDRRSRTLRVRRGPFAGGEGEQDVFVVRGDRAVRTPIHVGLINLDYVEILSGLAPGDEVIVSDMSDYLHLDAVRIE